MAWYGVVWAWHGVVWYVHTWYGSYQIPHHMICSLVFYLTAAVYALADIIYLYSIDRYIRGMNHYLTLDYLVHLASRAMIYSEVPNTWYLVVYIPVPGREQDISCP